MVIRLERDKDGNITYEEHDDGFYEISTYEENQLVRQETHYSNGIVDIDHYNVSRG